MGERICSIEGCEKRHFGNGLCNMHYSRLRRHGDTADKVPRTCSVEGCTARLCGNGLCNRHYMNLRRSGSVHGRGYAIAERNPMWKGDDAGYFSVHMRLARQRGPAVAHQCAHCGDPAVQWSYDHSDPDERHQEIKGYLMPYSTNLDLYDPLCLRCHRQRDQ